jgi:hypothetical protein
MRTIEQKIYKFSELSKEVKEKVIEEWYKKEEYSFLEMDLEESLKCNEKNIFEDDFKLLYSLSYCQGDGLSIKGDINIEKCLSLLFPKMKKKDREFYIENIHLFSTGNNGRYSFASRNDIESCCDDEKEEKLLFFESEYFPVIQDHYIDLCKKLELEGYSILEYRMDTEEFSDSNEYEYFENGKMYF